jgi:hypothetical protein
MFPTQIVIFAGRWQNLQSPDPTPQTFVVAVSDGVTFRNVTTTVTKDYLYLHPDK